MSYTATDQTHDNGAPITLYKIVADGQAFCYTDDAREYMGLGEVFRPQQIVRSDITNTLKLNDQSRFTITLPVTDELSQMLTGLITPLVLQTHVWEVHLTDPDAEPRQLHYGLVTGVASSDETVELSVSPALMAYLNGTIPRPMYSRECNHRFGDERCGYNIENVAYAGVIVVGIDLWTLDINAPIPNANTFGGGYVINLRTGVKQDIVDLTGTRLATLGGFVDVVVGDELKLYAGCDHVINGDCARYGNTARFMGFPHVPRKNPFLKGFGEQQYMNGDYYEPS